MVLWVIGTFTALLTAVYMTRMMVMTFWGKERFHEELPDEAHADATRLEAHDHGEDHDAAHDDHDDSHHALPPDFKPRESPWSMTVPLIVLAVLATFGGFLGVPYALSGGAVPNYIEQTLEPVVAAPGHEVADSHAPADAHETSSVPAAPTAAEPAHDEHSPEAIRLERILAGLSTVLALIGIGIGFAVFLKTPLRKMPKILEEKWRLDEFYNGYIVDPITNFSREVLWKGIDLGFIDGIVNGLGHLVTQLGNLARGIQVGFVRSYAAMIILGALALIGYFIFYGLKLVG
jgi:NADH-quinone oxidoreductase subunit L